MKCFTFLVQALLLCLAGVVVWTTASAQDDKIHVHVVPHTHDDVGWLKTVDEYYYGGNRSIFPAAVKYIIDSVIEELQKDESRTFIYVEMAFFARWWREQTDATKDIVKKLVSSKQLEFINGGWCMNDEASTHYNAIIDQMTLGLQFIEDNFGSDARPTIAWQIDPFGHSSTQAALFAQMGFDALFFGRHDYDDHKIRKNKTTLELVWQPSASLGASGDLFTGIMYNGYGQPDGFCFDTVCQNDLIQDDPSLDGYNVDSETDLFIKDIYEIAAAFATDNIMLTFGSDFQYQNARMNFDQMDKLIKYTTAKNSSLDIFYSTPSRYLQALHDADRQWTTKSDDFFPYADSPYSYWTGYFTSRPALKAYVREMNNLLQTCSQAEAMLSVFQGKPSSYSRKKLQEAMGVAQHHDAVSGTEKQHVAYDYARHLHMGAVDCYGLISDALGQYLVSNSSTPLQPPAIETCEYLNISVCPATETNNFNVIIYNPLGRSRHHDVRVPLTTNQALVTDSSGNNIPAQISPVSAAVSRVRGKRGGAEYELYFRVLLPALGFDTFFVREENKPNVSKLAATYTPSEIKKDQEDVVLQNKDVQVAIDGTSGRLKYISNRQLSLKMDQTFLWYNSSDGVNMNSSQRSGAYMFRPNGTMAWDVLDKGANVQINTVKGPLYEEVQQTYSDWVQQNIRLHKDGSTIEFDYIVGPIPFKDDLGKEVITRFTTNAETNNTWYTDSNGREMQKRILNYRPTWTLNVTEPVAGNYYPINSRMFMKFDDASVGSSQFTIMTDRSQGGASLNDGQLEIMVHRRTLYDDSRGVGEPINETGVDGSGLIIRGKHLVVLDDLKNSTEHHRLLGEAMMLRPQEVYVRAEGTYKNWTSHYLPKFSALKTELPTNVHLLTFQVMGEGKYLLRLEHQFEVGESPWDAAVSVSLADLFVFPIESATELGLAAVTPRTRLQWKTQSYPRGKPSGFAPILGPKFSVDLKPMEIRTFQVTITPTHK